MGITDKIKEGLDIMQNGDEQGRGAILSNKETPEQSLKNAYVTCYVVGVVNIIAGIVGFVVQSDAFLTLYSAVTLLVVGIIFLPLGAWAKKSRSATPLYIAFAILLLDLLVAITFSGVSLFGILLRLIFLVLLWKGASATKKIQSS